MCRADVATDAAVPLAALLVDMAAVLAAAEGVDPASARIGPVDFGDEAHEPRLPSIHDPAVAATEPHAMVNDDGEVFYPDGAEDAAYFAEHHGARPLTSPESQPEDR